ncbi:MAG: uncharacterized membrane protein YcgQ (UPF0703/DUF1980 family) [Rickettsiales bacterium]|jgi:uncharacterized membrane protein YcgQ (UPF0703/DUF1980 family)
MEFRTETRNYIARYYMGIYFFFVFIFMGIILLISNKKEVELSSMLTTFFLEDFRLSSLMITLIFLCPQLIGYLITQKKTKLLILDKSSLTFNFFNNTSLTLDYSEIRSLILTNDIFKNFEFILKNGEKKVIYPTLKDKMKAFEEINKKLN